MKILFVLLAVVALGSASVAEAKKDGRKIATAEGGCTSESGNFGYMASAPGPFMIQFGKGRAMREVKADYVSYKAQFHFWLAKDGSYFKRYDAHPMKEDSTEPTEEIQIAEAYDAKTKKMYSGVVTCD